MAKLVAAIFLILHGLVHIILAMVPDPDASEAVLATFFSRSWLLDSLGLSISAKRAIAITLAITAAIGFIATGLSLLDLLVPDNWWRTLAISSSLVSFFLLIIYWNPYLIVGVVIDIALLAALIFFNWSPE